MGKLKVILVVALIIVAVIFGIRLLTPEDSWVCENGTWTQHGHPQTTQPTTPCTK